MYWGCTVPLCRSSVYSSVVCTLPPLYWSRVASIGGISTVTAVVTLLCRRWYFYFEVKMIENHVPLPSFFPFSSLLFSSFLTPSLLFLSPPTTFTLLTLLLSPAYKSPIPIHPLLPIHPPTSGGFVIGGTDCAQGCGYPHLLSASDRSRE